MEPSRRSNRVSYHQLELLWEFLNSNRDIVTTYNRSLQSKEYSKRKWREIAQNLNSQGSGAHKDWKGWSKYWIDFKGKIKMKVAAVRSSHARTGGGPSNVKFLSEIELKFLQLLGQNFGQNLPGIRVDPFTETPDIDTDLVVHPSESIEVNIPLIGSPSLIPIQGLIVDYQEPPSQHVEANIQIPPDPIPMDTPRQSSPPAAQPRAHSPRRRRTRRDPPMSIETARRALVQSSRLHAEATVKVAESLEIIAEKITSIERILGCAFPRAAEQENSE